MAALQKYPVQSRPQYRLIGGSSRFGLDMVGNGPDRFAYSMRTDGFTVCQDGSEY